MTMQLRERRDYGFIAGLLTGTCVGAGVMLWLAPRMLTDLSERLTDSVDVLTRRGQDIRDDVADRVAHGAHEVERFAKAAKTAP